MKQPIKTTAINVIKKFWEDPENAMAESSRFRCYDGILYHKMNNYNMKGWTVINALRNNIVYRVEDEYSRLNTQNRELIASRLKSELDAFLSKNKVCEVTNLSPVYSFIKLSHVSKRTKSAQVWRDLMVNVFNPMPPVVVSNLSNTYRPDEVRRLEDLARETMTTSLARSITEISLKYRSCLNDIRNKISSLYPDPQNNVITKRDGMTSNDSTIRNLLEVATKLKEEEDRVYKVFNIVHTIRCLSQSTDKISVKIRPDEAQQSIRKEQKYVHDQRLVRITGDPDDFFGLFRHLSESLHLDFFSAFGMALSEDTFEKLSACYETSQQACSNIFEYLNPTQETKPNQLQNLLG